MSSCRVCKRGPGKCRKPGQAGHLDRGSWTESPGPGKKPAAAAAAAAAPTPPARPTRSGSRSGSRRGTAPGSGSGSGSSSTSEESADSEEEEEEEDEEDEEEEYEVEKIVAVQQRSAKERPLYRVRWRGYEHDDDTYEPVEALGSAQAKLRAFKQAVPEDEWPGSKLYVREHKGEKVTEAVVREVWAEPRHYFVHFLGWNSKWDEWCAAAPVAPVKSSLSPVCAGWIRTAWCRPRRRKQPGIRRRRSRRRLRRSTRSTSSWASASPPAASASTRSAGRATAPPTIRGSRLRISAACWTWSSGMMRR